MLKNFQEKKNRQNIKFSLDLLFHCTRLINIFWKNKIVKAWGSGDYKVSETVVHAHGYLFIHSDHLSTRNYHDQFFSCFSQGNPNFLNFVPLFPFSSISFFDSFIFISDPAFRFSVRLPAIGSRKNSSSGRLIHLLASNTESPIISKGISDSFF